MRDFGERLREERARLDLNQEAFGELGGVSKNAQLSYEKGGRSPDADYLMALMGHGVDVHYLLTGVRGDSAGGSITPEQDALLRLFDGIDPARRDAARLVLEALALASKQ